VNSPLSPLSPGSPSAMSGGNSDTATPTAAYHDVPTSPASPKPRKDSKSIFSNFSATRSSSRLTNMDNPNRQTSEKERHNVPYANGRSGGSTPDLSRPVQTPNSDGMHHGNYAILRLTRADNHSEPSPFEQQNGSGRSTDMTEADSRMSNSKRGGAKSKKQSGMLSRSRSIKTEEGTGRAKLNKSQPAKLSPDPSTTTWTHNGDGTLLKTAPLDKDKSWRQNISFGKLRTHSADRHDNSQLTPRTDDEHGLRRDRAEQSSVASSSYNESRGAQLMSNLGSGAMKMGEKFNSARKGMFGKLGRSSSNHERELQIPKEQYQFKIIHTPLVEQTRLTRISSRLENSKDKTEFWMPALPWRCIEYVYKVNCFGYDAN